MNRTTRSLAPALGFTACLGILLAASASAGDRSIASVSTAEAGSPAAAAAPLHFGAPVGDGEPIAIETLLADPDAWSGQEVVVEGAVIGVCEKAGCWMEIEGETASIRFKVDDGVMVFPVDAMGRQARARGKVETIDMDRDRYVAWRAHFAEERGEDFDEAMIGDGPYRIVRLRGLGAEITDG